VQVLGDSYGTVVQLGERDCTVQRRHQKVVEEAPPRNLAASLHDGMLAAALALARSVGYDNAGTVEFLVDVDAQRFYFIEVNPRIQVEHTVTEVVTGIDLVKAQIRIADGHARSARPKAACRFRTASCCAATRCSAASRPKIPMHNFTPTYGQITAYRPATGFGVRLDGGTAYAGAVVTPFYDSLLEKVTVWAPDLRGGACACCARCASSAFAASRRTSPFLDALLEHPDFKEGRVTTRFLDEQRRARRHAPLSRPRDARAQLRRRNDRQRESRGARPHAAEARVEPAVPVLRGAANSCAARATGCSNSGRKKFAQWMKDERRALVTDTTFRDAHQSLLATRVRTRDILRIAPAYAELSAGTVLDRMLGRRHVRRRDALSAGNPWWRLRALRERFRTSCCRCCCAVRTRSATRAIPTTSCATTSRRRRGGRRPVPDVRLAQLGREHARLDRRGARERQAVRSAMCYTGDILDPSRPKYDLAYYVALAKELEATGAHILGIKDMAGLVKPEAARRL
jgi:pyruvate carboxylase